MATAYRARVKRVGDLWRARVVGLPIEVTARRLDQLPIRLTDSLVEYLGVAEDQVDVTVEMPGAGRRWWADLGGRLKAVHAQAAGVVGALLGTAAVGGPALTLIIAGVLLAAVGTLREAKLI